MKHFAFTACLCLLSCLSLLAQEPPQAAPPSKEHDWLKQFEGEWETHSTATLAPDQPKFECKGVIKSRMLGGYWVVSEMETKLAGFEMTGLQTIGFDKKTKKYIGTWVDSSGDTMWKYQGRVDPTGKILTLEAEGPNHMTNKISLFRDVYDFQSKDEIKLTSEIQGEDGQWVTFMTGTAKRKK